MMHVSFAMTSEAFADGSKTETRRFWKPAHARKFMPGVVFMGITKDFRAGGQRMHAARVVFCQQEPLGHMSTDSFVREGGTRYWKSREEYIAMMGGEERVPWVLRFEHVPKAGGDSQGNLGQGNEVCRDCGPVHHCDCDVNDINADGIVKPCNCGVSQKCAVQLCGCTAVCELAVDGEWFPICKAHSINRIAPRRSLSPNAALCHPADGDGGAQKGLSK